MTKTEIDYIYLDEIKGYEFGLIIHIEDSTQPIEILVIHHESYMVRTIDTASDISVALELVKQCIEKGFTRSGLYFSAIQNYRLPVSDYTNLSAIL